MLEVKPKADVHPAEATIGQVVLKRLLTADQVIERLCKESSGLIINTLSQNALHPSAQRNVLTESDEQLLPEPTSAIAQP